MSFKIFHLQLFGKIKSVELIESQRKVLRTDFEEFQRVDKSEELKEYLELEKFVNSEAFKNEKAETEALVFKGSRECNQLKELGRLNKASKIKKYFKVDDSADLKKFVDKKDSDEIREHDKLRGYIKDGQFQKEKKEIKADNFKGSVEEKHWLDFKRLAKSSNIKAYFELYNSEALEKHKAFGTSDKLKRFVTLRNAPDRDKEKQKELKKLQRDLEIKAYFRFEKSKKLRLYHETVDSHNLDKYTELKAYIESDEYKKREIFLKDKRKFEKSETYKKQLKYKQLAADSTIKFVLKFEKSALYKNYLDVKDSFDLKRYFELDELTKSEVFINRKAYLEDKKKWSKTDSFKRQQDFFELKELPHFINYFKYNGTTSFDFLTQWKIAFEDDFAATKLNNEKWTNIDFIGNKMLGDNYSMPGDLHVFANGNNIKTEGKLTISVKKETKDGKVWKMPAGFISTQFEYTSDLVSTGNSFWQEDGIFEAKIKYNPLKQVVSSFYLSGENNMPRINLLEMGTKNNVGISILNNSGKMEINGLDISNLKSGKYYIFSVEKSGNSLTWRINDTEVFQITDSALNFPLHMNASSIVVYDVKGSNLPVNFEIEWVKCYRKK